LDRPSASRQRDTTGRLQWIVVFGMLLANSKDGAATCQQLFSYLFRWESTEMPLSEVDMSSRGNPAETRRRILDAALDFFQRGEVDASMQAITKAAGFSRQTLYLNFADRGAFYVAVVERAEERFHFSEEYAKIERAPNGIAALGAIVDLQARISRLIKPIAYALDILRNKDNAVEKARQKRMDRRMAACEAIVARLAAEGLLRRDITVKPATDILWLLTSFHTWDDLVNTRKWTTAQYRDFLKHALITALITPGKGKAPKA
jgi:AcrR family transcriptional regulator